MFKKRFALKIFLSKKNLIILFDYMISVTSVSYIFNKAAFLIRSIIFNTIRLNLACLDKGIYFYINVFFYVHISFSLNCLIHIHLYDLTLC